MFDLKPVSSRAHVFDTSSRDPMFFLLYHQPVLIIHKHIRKCCKFCCLLATFVTKKIVFDFDNRQLSGHTGWFFNECFSIFLLLEDDNELI